MGRDIHAKYYVRSEQGLEEFQIEEHEDVCQSSPLFAALGARGNAFGITPIAESRGFPPELSALEPPQDEYLHSASHLTLAELLAYDWLGGPWQQLRPTLGNGDTPLWVFTRLFRELTLPALARHGEPDRVLMVYFFDN